MVRRPRRSTWGRRPLKPLFPYGQDRKPTPEADPRHQHVGLERQCRPCTGAQLGERTASV